MEEDTHMEIFWEKDISNLVDQLVGCKKKIENDLLVELVLNVFFQKATSITFKR
jgi:hypothetical protein